MEWKACTCVSKEVPAKFVAAICILLGLIDLNAFAQTAPDEPLFYKFKIMARTDRDELERIEEGVSINDNGVVAFVARKWGEDELRNAN